MRYGFAREGAKLTTASRQAEELADCDDVITGGNAELAALLERLNPGDALEVLRIDCLATTVAGVRNALSRLDACQAHLVSRAEGVNTEQHTGNKGELLRRLLDALAEVEAASPGLGRSS